MIVFPMLGRSSRFFNAGYKIPKYQLPLWDSNVFSYCVKTFEKYFSTDAFTFIVRNDYEAMSFVALAAINLGIKDFRVKEVDYETAGQAESVYLAIKELSDEEELIIFNIDTIRTKFIKPSPEQYGDGFLEVFEGEGHAWSFVETVAGSNKVIRTTEKIRISNKCSDGLYGFKTNRAFKDAFNTYKESGETVNGEIYIAPIYNKLISNGADIRAFIVDQREIFNCGIPADYEYLKTIIRE